jgi:hypothetical protein
MAGRYTGSYPDQCSGWRAVAALADIGQASLVGRIPKDQYTLVEVVSKSASEGETDMASEHLYVADVPRTDIQQPTHSAFRLYSGGIPVQWLGRRTIRAALP